MAPPVEPSDTVFYLIPRNKHAEDIVDHPPNSNRTWPDPEHPSVPWLRIGLDQSHNNHPQIARFGRLSHNDVILPGKRFSRSDQCYFSFNKDTGELLLHDLSEKEDTHLCQIELNNKGEATESKECELRNRPRQCVVLLTPDPYRNDNDPRGRQRKYVFKIREAEFWLIPPTAENTVSDQTVAKIEFANQDHPEQTVEGTLDRIIATALQIQSNKGTTASYQSSLKGSRKLHNTRFRTLLEPDNAVTLDTTKVGFLGRGGQGDVHLVVDNYTGDHIACKNIALVRAELLNMSARDFRTKVELEVKLVQRLRHPHIVPYIHCQGFTGQVIELFMPVYNGSLHELARGRRLLPEDMFAVTLLTNNMLSQILDALDFVHTRNPPIIHRDIKPANILYQYTFDEQGNMAEKFLLADFGLAKVQDASQTKNGTPVYWAPEVESGGEWQTTKLDIYSLGVTVVDCFTDVIHLKDDFPGMCTRELQRLMSIHSAQYMVSMLETDPNRRPTAQELRQLQMISIFQPIQPADEPVEPAQPPMALMPPMPPSPSQPTDQRPRPGGHRRSGSSSSRAEAGPSRPSGVSKGKRRASSRSIIEAQEPQDR